MIIIQSYGGACRHFFYCDECLRRNDESAEIDDERFYGRMKDSMRRMKCRIIWTNVCGEKDEGSNFLDEGKTGDFF